MRTRSTSPSFAVEEKWPYPQKPLKGKNPGSQSMVSARWRLASSPKTVSLFRTLPHTYRTSSDSCSSSSDSESARLRRNVFPVIRIAAPDLRSSVTSRVVQGTSFSSGAQKCRQSAGWTQTLLRLTRRCSSRTATSSRRRKAKSGTAAWPHPRPRPSDATTLTTGVTTFEPHGHAPAAGHSPYSRHAWAFNTRTATPPARTDPPPRRQRHEPRPRPWHRLSRLDV